MWSGWSGRRTSSSWAGTHPEPSCGVAGSAAWLGGEDARRLRVEDAAGAGGGGAWSEDGEAWSSERWCPVEWSSCRSSASYSRREGRLSTTTRRFFCAWLEGRRLGELAGGGVAGGVGAARHAARLASTRRGEEWTQGVRGPEEGPAVEVEEVDLSGEAVGCEGRRIEEESGRVQSRMRLAGPLVRVCLFRMGDGSARVLMAIHHLVVDGVSWRVVLEDVERWFGEVLRGERPKLLGKTTSYRRWAELVRREASSLRGRSSVMARAEVEGDEASSLGSGSRAERRERHVRRDADGMGDGGSPSSSVVVVPSGGQRRPSGCADEDSWRADGSTTVMFDWRVTVVRRTSSRRSPGKRWTSLGRWGGSRRSIRWLWRWRRRSPGVF